MGTHYEGTEAENLALDWYIKLFRAAESVGQHINAHLREHDLTTSQFGALEALYHLGPMQSGELGQKILKTSGNMTMVIDHLEKQGYVTRQRREDGPRCVDILLTEPGRTLIEVLAQRLAQDLRAKVEGTETPAEVGEFVVGPWAQVLAEFELRGAAGGTDPDGLLTLADDLIWSVQPKVAKRNRARLVDLVPSLLVRLRQGLQLIDFPADLVNRFFDQLIAVHERALEESRPPPAQPGAAPESEAEAAPTLSGVTEEEAGF